jgi:hypothetical protein
MVVKKGIIQCFTGMAQSSRIYATAPKLLQEQKKGTQNQDK